MNSNALSLSNCRGRSDKGRRVARCQVLMDTGVAKPKVSGGGWGAVSRVLAE
jgi:hypothetical protein